MNKFPNFSIIGFLLSGLLLFACGSDEEGISREKEIIKPVKYAEISLSGGIQQRRFNGSARSGSETNLSFRTNGLIQQIRVKVGDRVRQGQLLAQLDQRDQSLSYEQGKSSVQSAKIQLETTKSSLERTKELYQASSSSLAEYEQSKNSYAAALSNYQTAQKALDLQASQFSYAKIIAPTKGVVSSVNAEINEFAQAGSPIIIMNSGGGDLEVNVGVPESYITRIKQGDKVQVVINRQDIEGVVSEVGFSSSSSTTYPVIVKVSEPNEEVRPGMPAEVTFSFGSVDEAPLLWVPVKAVGEDADNNFVFRLQLQADSGYQVEKVPIEIGPLGDNGFVVISGLEAGNLVATAGLRSLYNGRIVSLLQP